MELSTCEVELFAIAEIAKNLVWFSNLFKELKCLDFVNFPVNVYCDNNAAISWCKSAKSSVKTRHVCLKLHFVKDLIKSNQIQYCIVKLIR